LDGETLKLVEVGGGEGFEPAQPGIGEFQPHHAVIIAVADAADQSRGFGAFDQAAGAVVSQQEVLSHLANGRPAAVGVPADGQQQLMLHGRESRRLGLFGAPSLEAA
jgi:hypothetical protein